MGTKRVKLCSLTLLVPITKWRITESPPTFCYCCILHYLTYFLFFKPAAPSVFCGATDAICICTETSCVTTVCMALRLGHGLFYTHYGRVQSRVRRIYYLCYYVGYVHMNFHIIMMFYPWNQCI